MKKTNLKWSIKDLQEKFDIIEFPEFQREPTVWNLEKKRKLIDSILRQFDIASIYLYKRDDDHYECIDGKQRINAIISFLGLNELPDEVEDRYLYNNNFKFISSDELLCLEKEHLKDFNNKNWQELTPEQQRLILKYEFNVLEITDIEADVELNLMFLRLQLGASLNVGEKLKAMVGDMKDLIFGSKKIKKPLGIHPYFNFLNIPKRRFSKELTAAQITINFFSLYKGKGFQRARFIDLQEFLKNYVSFTEEEKKITNLLRERLDRVYNSIKDFSELTLKNRAIGITTFFFINKLIESNVEQKIPNFIKFLNTFLSKLKKEVEKGIDIDPEYRDLLKFQAYISQAAVEKYAIENRQKFLEEYFEFYLQNKRIKTIND